MKQLPLDLGLRPALGREAFLVAPSNETALAMIEDWARWPQGKLVLTGPRGAGKTHLAHVWAQSAGAAIHDAADPAALLPVKGAQAMVLEDVDLHAKGQAAWEQALFHLHNQILEGGGRLLLTARTPARDWQVSLPDLRSRMEGTSHVALQPPDDALLAGVLVKLFADRRIRVEPRVIDYLLLRIDRSVAAAEAIVAALDEAALSEGRELRVPLVRRVLADAD